MEIFVPDPNYKVDEKELEKIFAENRCVVRDYRRILGYHLFIAGENSMRIDKEYLQAVTQAKVLKNGLKSRDFEHRGVHHSGWWTPFFFFLSPLAEGRLGRKSYYQERMESINSIYM